MPGRSRQTHRAAGGNGPAPRVQERPDARAVNEGDLTQVEHDEARVAADRVEEWDGLKVQVPGDLDHQPGTGRGASHPHIRFRSTP